jgi:outer membrane protein OmpA-like peptidoglycan-associated protein
VCGASAPGLVLTLLLAAALLPGCSRTDPIEQARLAAGRAPTSTLPPVPGAGEPYPNLGSVPPRPETTSPAARQALENALVADRANARYVGQPAVPPVPRGQVAEAPASLAAPLGAGSPMLLGAEQNDALPMAPPPPAPPPIAGAPRQEPEPAPPAAAPPAVLGIPQAPPPPPAAPPSPAEPPRAVSAATGPAPPAGRVETAPIAPIAMEPLAPPPPPAMPDELPPRARAAEAPSQAPPALPRPAPVSTDPPPVLLPAEPRAASAPALPAPPAAAPAAPTAPAAPQAAAMAAQAPPRPVQPSVVIDRTALAPTRGGGAGGSGYALGFLPGTATLIPSDRAVLADLAGRGGTATFQVTGFADEAGSGRALDLPLARARAVADALRAAGVPAEQIELGGSARPGPAGRGAEVRLVYTR